jgi:hypothetical protein
METGFVRGVIPPIITPVDGDERVDEGALRRMIDHVIAGGVHGILSLGSNGEFFGLDRDEQRRAVAVTLDHVAGRVPVYVGIGGISTRECVRTAVMAGSLGAQAVTMLPPMFLSPNDEELYRHFLAVAESTDLPVLLYNNPDRMRVNLSAALVERLADVPNIVGAKDSSGDMVLTAEYIRRTRRDGEHRSGPRGGDLREVRGRRPGRGPRGTVPPRTLADGVQSREFPGSDQGSPEPAGVPGRGTDPAECPLYGGKSGEVARRAGRGGRAEGGKLRWTARRRFPPLS